MVIRQILVSITYSPNLSTIKLHYIVIQKEHKDSPPVVYSTYHTIVNDNFPDTQWSTNKIRQYLKENEYKDTYKSDEIFGHRVKLFADLSGQKNISKQKLDSVIAKAKHTANQNFNNPPSFKEEKNNRDSLNKTSILFCLALALIVIYLLKNRKR